MNEKTLIFGVSYGVDSLILALLKKKIDLNLDKNYYVNISPPPIPDSTYYGNAVISGIFVDLSEKLVKTIIGWLRERENEYIEKPKLKICIDGNLLNINIQDMEILQNVMQECAKNKERKTLKH
ncbi:hypothetical protein KJN74_05095 [Candidatus Bathyarchaeota archaeon]|nr:hypothetical protein [Candidatus Bathyarchaeota archaeon]